MLPAGLTATLNNGTVSQGAYDPVTGLWTVGTIIDGGSATLVLEGTVDTGEGGNTIANVTTAASGDQPDPSTVGDDLDESVLVVAPEVGLAKSAGDAIANGDNFDVPFTFVYENTGTVALTSLSLTDDIATEFGNAFVNIAPGSLMVQNFAGSGTAPGANAAWEGNTMLDMLDGSGQLNVGDSFEVTFIVTVDPGWNR